MTRTASVTIIAALFASALTMSALAQPQVLFERDFVAADGAILSADDGYTPWVSGFFGLPDGAPLTGLTLTVEASASSPDGCPAGAILLLYDAQREKVGTAQAWWDRTLPEDFATVSGDAVIDTEGATFARLALYRSSHEGTLQVRTAQVFLPELVASEELVAELEAELVAQGWETAREGVYLVARKPDERQYWHTLPSESLKREDFRARSYAGATFVRREFEPPRFPIGPYIYGRREQMESLAQAAGTDVPGLFDMIAADVAAHGGNTIYYANLTMDPDLFTMATEAAARHGVAVFGQLTSDLYLRPERGREHYETVTLPTAREVLPQYRGMENVLGWMGKEEAAVDQMPLVREYRAALREIDPTHALFTLHNHLTPFQAEGEPLPEWFGFDRYRFRCLKAHYGLLISTPRDMAIRLRGEISAFSTEAGKRGRPLIFVMQGYGHQNRFTTEDIVRWSGGAKDRLDPWSGFTEIEPGVWEGWDRYPPPPGGMSLQSWLAVSEGAAGLLIYHYHGLPRPDGERYIALVNEKGEETRLWREFGECVTAMKPLQPLFLSWHREAVPRASADSDWVKVRSFIRDFDAERYLVVVNERIATWDEDSPALPRGETELHFDDEGLAGLQEAGPLTFRLSVEGDAPLWDVRSGEQLRIDSAGGCELTLPGGGGTVLMQGDEATLRALRAELGL